MRWLSYGSKSVLGFELLEKIHVVVDQGESSGLTASEVSAESKTRDDISCSLVHLGQFLGNLLLGDCGASRMENIHNLKCVIRVIPVVQSA